MTIDLRGRDFLKEVDFTAAEFSALIDLAARLKSAGRDRVQLLQRRNIALIFEKTSTRTRAAFEVAAHHQGANVTYIDPTSSQMGHKESTADTARVLSRMFDAIEFRGGDHQIVEDLAEYSDVPVYNGLTDKWHPTQMLADFLTMREHSSDGEISFAYLGDARNNMANSLLVTAALLGADVRICAPTELQPESEIQELAHSLAVGSGARIQVTDDVAGAVAGVQFVHTDVWVSMGEPAEVWQQRVELLRGYRVDDRVMAMTGRADARFMHCLPAYHDTNTKVGAQMSERFGMDRGIEVASSVFDSAANIAFDQAENRLHTIEAVLVATLADQPLSDI